MMNSSKRVERWKYNNFLPFSLQSVIRISVQLGPITADLILNFCCSVFSAWGENMEPFLIQFQSHLNGLWKCQSHHWYPECQTKIDQVKYWKSFFWFCIYILFFVCALVPRNNCKLGKLEIRLTFIKVVRGHSFLPLTFCPSQDLYLPWTGFSNGPPLRFFPLVTKIFKRTTAGSFLPLTKS